MVSDVDFVLQLTGAVGVPFAFSIAAERQAGRGDRRATARLCSWSGAASPSARQIPLCPRSVRGTDVGVRRDVFVVRYYPTLISIKLDLTTHGLGFE